MYQPWIEKKFREPGDERTLQGSNSSASPGKEKRSAGDKKRDKKWREYQEFLAAEAAQAGENETKGGTPAPSSQQASGGHHPGHTTLGDFLEVAKKAKAKPRQLHLRKSDPSSDVGRPTAGGCRLTRPAPAAALLPTKWTWPAPASVPAGCPAKLGVARQRATEQNAALEGAVGIAQHEAADWGRGMAFHASAVAAIAAGVTAAAAQDAAAVRVRSEVAAAAQEAAAAQDGGHTSMPTNQRCRAAYRTRTTTT